MNTTGATVWDFLISMRLPIWIVLIIIILVFCISKRLKFRGIPLKSEFERSFPQV